MTFLMPSGVGSGVYDLRVLLDFTQNSPAGGEYFKVQDDAVYNAGIQTEFVVETSPESIIVIAGSEMVINATITDIEDNSQLQGVLADIYFDWGGPNQQLMENQTTGTDGIVTFSPTIPADTAPGYYSVRVLSLIHI